VLHKCVIPNELWGYESLLNVGLRAPVIKQQENPIATEGYNARDSGVLRTLADIPGWRSGLGKALVSNREEVGLIFENKRTILRHTFVVLSVSITALIFAGLARKKKRAVRWRFGTPQPH